MRPVGKYLLPVALYQKHNDIYDHAFLNVLSKVHHQHTARGTMSLLLNVMLKAQLPRKE